MGMFVASDSTISRDKAPLLREKFTMPDGREEEKIEWVNAIKPEAPFENVTIGGFNFEKFIYSADASLQHNADKPAYPRIMVRKFTEKQAEALRVRSKEHFVRVKGERVCVADYLIIQKKTEYNPNETIVNQVKAADKSALAKESMDDNEKMREAMISEQSKKARR